MAITYIPYSERNEAGVCGSTCNRNPLHAMHPVFPNEAQKMESWQYKYCIWWEIMMLQKLDYLKFMFEFDFMFHESVVVHSPIKQMRASISYNEHFFLENSITSISSLCTRGNADE
jgi:hypothetical protein